MEVIDVPKTTQEKTLSVIKKYEVKVLKNYKSDGYGGFVLHLTADELEYIDTRLYKDEKTRETIRCSNIKRRAKYREERDSKPDAPKVKPRGSGRKQIVNPFLQTE